MKNIDDEVQTIAREIVAKRVAIVAVVGFVASYCVSRGWIPTGIDAQATDWAGRAIDVLAVIIGILWARTGTTTADPMLNPISSNGQPLVELPPEPAGGWPKTATAAMFATPVTGSAAPTAPPPEAPPSPVDFTAVSPAHNEAPFTPVTTPVAPTGTPTDQAKPQ